MSPAVTIVLPVHNVERILGEMLRRVLDLAYSTGCRLQVALIDDGSTDGTFEVACEMARRHPQLRVLRQPVQRGLRAALEQVRQELGVDHVVAHDGLAAVDFEELGEVLQTSPRASLHQVSISLGVELTSGGRRAGRGAPAALPDWSTAKSTASFRWLRLDAPGTPRRRRVATAPVATALDSLVSIKPRSSARDSALARP